MKKDINLENLTPEQLAYIKSLEKDIEEKNKLLALQEKEIKDKDDLIKTLQQLVKNKKEIIKRYNFERFVSKKDAPLEKSSGLKSTTKTDPKTPGRKKGSKNFSDLDLESLSAKNEVITLDVAESLLKENPSLELKQIDEETTYLIKRIKASIEVHKVVNKVYKGSDKKIYRAENNLTPINHSMIHSSLLSDAITMKYFLGVPDYRYAKRLNAEGLYFSQKNLNNWALNSAELLKDFYEKMKTLFTSKESKISNIHIDETWVDVISNKKIGRQKSYIFCYSAEGINGKIPFFEFSRNREINSVKKILDGFEGVIIVDGYAGYNELVGDKIVRQRCMVHARREFANIVKILKPKQREKSVAYKIVQKIDEIFKYEKEFKEENLTPEERKTRRNSEEYLKIKSDIEEIIKNTNPLPGTQLAEAIKYWKNAKDELWTYLDYGEVDLDNNEGERQVKKFVIDRKNFLFSKNDNGAKASCILLTILDFAYSNNIDPRGYLEYLLDNHKTKKFEDLLPWSEDIEKNYSLKK